MDRNQKERNQRLQIYKYHLQPNQTQKNSLEYNYNLHAVYITNKRDQSLKAKNFIQNKLNQLTETYRKNLVSSYIFSSHFLSEFQKFNSRIQYSQIVFKKFVKDLKQFCNTISEEKKELITELKINLIIFFNSILREQILRHLFMAFPKLQTIVQNWWLIKHQRVNTRLDLDQSKIKQQINLRHAKQLLQIIENYLKRKRNRFYCDLDYLLGNQYQNQDNFLGTLSKTNEQIRSLITQIDIDLIYSSLTDVKIVKFCKLFPNLRSQKLQLMKKFLQFKQIMLKKYPILNLVLRSEQILHKCFMKASNYIQQNNQNSQLPNISSRLSLNLLLQNDLIDDQNKNENNLVIFLTTKYLQTLKIKEQSQQTSKFINYSKKYKKYSKSLEKLKDQLQYHFQSRKRIRSQSKRKKFQLQHTNLIPQLYLSIKNNFQLVGNQCTTLFKQVAKQIKDDCQKQNQQQKEKVINIKNIQKKLQYNNQFEKKSKIIKFIEYVIHLVAQAKFDSKTEQTQKGLMNIQDNNQKEGSKLLNKFQEKEKIKVQLQNMTKNYKPDDKTYQEEVIKLLEKQLNLLKQLNTQIKFLETKKREGNIQSIIQLASFSQMMKFQPLNIVQKLQKMSRLKLSNNSSFVLCALIKDVQLKLISKIFYLAIKMLQNYFNDLFQRTYGIEQSIIIAYLSKIYLCLKQIIQFQRKKIDENSKGISLDKNQKHRQDFIIASWKEAVQKIEEAQQMKIYSILQKLQNRSGWIQLLQENLECQTIQEAINQLNLHLDNLNYFFQQHIQKMPCLQQDDQKYRKDLEVFIFDLVQISKLIIKTFKLRMNETVSQTEKSESSNILLQDLIFLSENLKEDQFNLKPFNQEQFQINRSQRKKI